MISVIHHKMNYNSEWSFIETTQISKTKKRTIVGKIDSLRKDFHDSIVHRKISKKYKWWLLLFLKTFQKM